MPNKKPNHTVTVRIPKYIYIYIPPDSFDPVRLFDPSLSPMLNYILPLILRTQIVPHLRLQMSWFLCV